MKKGAVAGNERIQMISDTIIFEKYPSYIEYHPAFFFNFLFLQRPFSNNTRLVETVAINRRKKMRFHDHVSWRWQDVRAASLGSD